MTTPSELGFVEPVGTDLISKGDDAITVNARASAAMYDGLYGIRAWRLFPLGTDLDDWLVSTSASAGTSGVSASILNKPPGFTTDPFVVHTTQVSSANGIWKQTAEQKMSGSGDYRHSVRWSLSNVFYPWQTVSDTKPSLDPTMIAVFGDSQSEAAAGTSWPEYASPLLNGSTLVNYARSGDDTNAILIRAGAKIVSFRVTGGSIPASGAVALTTSERLFLRENRAIVGGSIAGVSGTLTHTTGDNWTFTRSAAGAAVSAPGWQDFTTGISTAAGTVLFWMGGNDFNQGVKGQERSTGDHVLGAYRQAMEWGRVTGRRVIVAGVTNRLTALAGSEGFAEVQRINRTLRTLYPEAFMDVQAYYVERAIYDMGLTPTAAELLGMNRGEIPEQLYIDNVHLSGAAHKALSDNWAAPWLAARGYAHTTSTLPALPEISPADLRTIGYDTGWHDVSADLTNGWTGELHIRRVDNTVWYRVRNLNPAAATAHAFYQQVYGLRIWQTYAADPGLGAYTDTIYRLARNMASPALNHYWRMWSFVSDEGKPSDMPGVSL